METMLTRLRKIFLDSGESQTAIAKKTNVTSAYIWKILNNDSVRPRDLFIDSVCREYNINEDWLRNGTGEMFKKIPAEDETAAYVSELLEDEDNPLYSIIKGIMKTYSQLDNKSQEILRDFSKSLLHNMNTEKED